MPSEPNILIAGSYDQRRYRVWDVKKLDNAQMVRSIEGEFKHVQKVVKTDKTVVAMLLARGQYRNDAMLFDYEIEIVDFMTNENRAKIEISLHNQVIEAEPLSLISTQPGILYYLTKAGEGNEKECYMNCWQYEKKDL